MRPEIAGDDSKPGGDGIMHARVTTIQFHPGESDEANRIVRDSIVPVLYEQEGFKGQLLLVDRSADKAASINLWETEAELVAFETSPLYRELAGHIAGTLAGPPATKRYEVSVQA